MYQLEYDSKVSADILQLGEAEKQRIKQAINEKLAHNPILYGKPLQYSLLGLRSFRVGDYRVVFKLETNSIFIVYIGHRKHAYKLAEKRIA